ncbi:MAG: hypothetical protein II664_04255 [Oscillospiraceae bacterium]|nr:hypothetical protein [Oscillospiraceae bacterium]
MEKLNIEIAGVSAGVVCSYPENIEFLRDYKTDREPLFTVSPRRDDLERMQADFDRMDEAAGIPKHIRQEGFLENNAIHAMLAEKMTEHGVLLMHGSALCIDGEAIIFTAPSGTGKSTHSRLWREVFGERVFMINDDKPFLRFADDIVYACGSPWNGKHHLGRNVCVPLKAIVSLERAEENSIVPMSKADAFPVLIKQAYKSRDAASMRHIAALEKLLIDKVRFYKLSCNMEHDAAVTAYNTIFAP